jgi:hypothetical protein
VFSISFRRTENEVTGAWNKVGERGRNKGFLPTFMLMIAKLENLSGAHERQGALRVDSRDVVYSIAYIYKKYQLLDEIVCRGNSFSLYWLPKKPPSGHTSFPSYKISGQTAYFWLKFGQMATRHGGNTSAEFKNIKIRAF